MLRTAFSGCRGITRTAPDRGTCVPLREPRFYPQKYGAFSANSVVVFPSVSRKKRARASETSREDIFKTNACESEKLPLSQGTAFIRCPRFRAG